MENINPENQQAQRAGHISNHEIVTAKKKGKRGVKALLIIVGVLMLTAIAVGVLFMYALSNYKRLEKDMDDYIVIAEKLNLVQKTSEDGNGKITFTVVRELPFITQVEINRREDIVQQDGKTYYRCTYYRLDEGSPAETFEEKENYYLETAAAFDDLEYRGNRKEYLNVFPVREARQLPVSVKRGITGYSYDMFHELDKLRFTQDANRIRKSIVLADFNMDGEQDAAVVLENEDFAKITGAVDTYKSHTLLILCYNMDSGKSYVAFSNYYYYPAVINTFKKGAQIFINSEALVNAPNNGVIYEISGGGETLKYAVLYNPETMQFEKHAQMPLSEIQEEYANDHEYLLEAGDDEEYEEAEDDSDAG